MSADTDIPVSSIQVKPSRMTTPTPPEGGKLLPCPKCKGPGGENIYGEFGCDRCRSRGMSREQWNALPRATEGSTMTTEPIDVCAAAIAGVREKYWIARVIGSSLRCVMNRKTGVPVSGTHGNILKCQAWLNREAARACLDAQWQPIETAPKDGQSIIAWVPGFAMGGFVLFWDDGWREPVNMMRLKIDPVFWQPFIAPPAAITKQEDV